MAWNRVKNGKLLQQAVDEDFDILLPIDKNIDSQQNISKYNISLVILDVLKSNLKYFEGTIPLFNAEVEQMEKGKSYLIQDE